MILRVYVYIIFTEHVKKKNFTTVGMSVKKTLLKVKWLANLF